MQFKANLMYRKLQIITINLFNNLFWVFNSAVLNGNLRSLIIWYAGLCDVDVSSVRLQNISIGEEEDDQGSVHAGTGHQGTIS